MDMSNNMIIEPGLDFDESNRHLFYDELSDRYFYGNLLFVMKVISIDYLKLNDIYKLLGLPKILIGEEIIPLKCEWTMLESPNGSREKFVFKLSRK